MLSMSPCQRIHFALNLCNRVFFLFYHPLRDEQAAARNSLASPAIFADLQGNIRVDSCPGTEHDHQQPQQFAVLLNHLFATRLASEGRPYTLTEVAKATGMSVPYLCILRKGTISAVPFQRVVALARFFHVSLDYFSQEGPPVDTMDALVRDALAKPLVREVALRAGKVGTAQRALVLQMLEHADRVLQELAAPPPVRPDEASSLFRAEEPA